MSKSIRLHERFFDRAKSRGPLFFGHNVDAVQQKQLGKDVARARSLFSRDGIAPLMDCRVFLREMTKPYAGLEPHEIAGLYWCPPDDLIEINTTCGAVQGSYLHTLVHECGHRFDYLVRDHSDFDHHVEDFYFNARFTDHKAFITDYSMTKHGEFWAEAFMAYYIGLAGPNLKTWVRSTIRKYRKFLCD